MILRVLFAVLFSVPGFGQNYTLKTIPVRNELNTYLLTSEPFVDKDGFVWYAVNTEGIFYKYDGRNQIQHSLSDKNKKRVTISTSSIYDWIQDKNGNILAINLRGMYIINPQTFKVRYVKWKLKNFDFRDFKLVSSLQDKVGNIWISLAENYIIKLNPDYRQVIYQHPKLTHKNRYVNVGKEKLDAQAASLKLIKELSDGRVLLQSYYHFYIIDSYGIRLLNLKQKPDNNVHFVKNGLFFKKNSSGIIFFNTKSYNYKYIKEIDLQIFECPYDNFLYLNSKFLAVQNNTIFVNAINQQRTKFLVTDTIKFKSNILNGRLRVGRDNIIWFSTYDNIYMLKANDCRFKKYLQFKNFQVSTRNIVPDNQGNLYVGSYNGLYKLNTKRNTFSKIYDPKYPHNYYNSIFIDKDSVLWSVGEGRFIKAINLHTRNIKTTSYQGKEDFHSTFIKERSKDSLWIGSDKGLFIFSKSKGTFERFKTIKGDSSLTINDIIKDRRNIIWMATDQGLYFKKSKGLFADYGNQHPYFKNQIILVLHEDKNKNLWVGTNNAGVAYINTNTGRIKIYDQSKGLSNNTVCGILESYEQMWFSTFYGLSVLNKKTDKFNNYYIPNGLSENEFNKRSFLRKDSYSFYFGGLNGIIELNPKNFYFNKKAYKIYISKKEYFSQKENRNITEYGNNHENIELPNDKNYFSAEFSINDLYDHEKSTYYYRIKGLTDGWTNAGVSGLVKLYNIPPGNYLLEVKGKDFEGFETINKIKITIHVEQVFYKSTYFLAIIGLLLASFIVYEFRRKTRKQKKAFEREKEIINLKANALKAQMNPHFIFNILNNMQSIMILKGESEANKYFGAFSRLLRLTLDMSKLELVSLEDELKYIKYYLILNNLQLNDELHFSIDSERINRADRLFIPGMLIQPFVENAIVHGLSPKESGSKIIDIKCHIENNYLIVVIEDNGIGMEAAKKLINKRDHLYKSWSTTIVNERINVINSSSYSDAVVLHIENIEKNGKCAGTLVKLKFRIK